MADPRFFAVSGPYTLSDIARRVGATLVGGDRLVRDVAPLEAAGPEEVAFFDNRKYAPALATTKAGGVIVHPDLASRMPEGVAALTVEQPYHAYAMAASLFHPRAERTSGIAPTAIVDPTATLGAGVRIEPYAVIGARAEIGAGTRVGPHAVLAEGVVLGEDCDVGAHVSLSHCYIGKRVVLHPGVRIGQDGFGFALGKVHLKVPQLGRVIIEDDVEIGANAAIDRGAGPDTVIKAGTIIDNLVQIGHNVVVGRGCVLVSQVGISGSTRLGDYVMAGGQAGLAGHLDVGDGARVAAKAGVMSDIPAGVTVSGIPAVPKTQFFRQVAAVQRLARGKGS